MIRKVGKFYYRLKGHYPVRINGKRLKGDPFHIGFWRIVNHGGFEPGFYAVLDKYLKPHHVYCDIGSWIGPTAVYAAPLCRHVHCFEPDTTAFPFLEKNIQLNHLQNVTTYPVALGVHDGEIRMASHGGRIGDSMTSMVNIDHMEDAIVVPSMRWETWLKKYNPEQIDFIKMDIEGGEVEVIPGMHAYLKSEKPILHLSVHGRYLPLEDRRERLKGMFSLLQCYSRCYDEQMRRMVIDDQLAENSMDSFRSFLFIP